MEFRGGKLLETRLEKSYIPNPEPTYIDVGFNSDDELNQFKNLAMSVAKKNPELTSLNEREFIDLLNELGFLDNLYRKMQTSKADFRCSDCIDQNRACVGGVYYHIFMKKHFA